MAFVDLEISVQRWGEGYAADVRFRTPDGVTDSELATNVPVQLDDTTLREQLSDPAAYGRQLTEMLFADERMRSVWQQARGFAAGAGVDLRVRLRLDPDDNALHAICWETLFDPERNVPIGRSERCMLSRYLDSPDLTRIELPPQSQVKILVAVASPRNLARYNAQPFDAAAEARRVTASCGHIPVTTMISADGSSPVSLSGIADALRDGYSVLYLVCHGTLRDGMPILYLEDEAGNVDHVSGEELARRIEDLGADRRPLLVVLSSCQSVGLSHSGEVLSAIGPRLARAGVAAVIGMQGDVPMKLVADLMPRFFRELSDNGLIDQALAAARAGVESEDPWWMPALYLRVRNGRLWQEQATPVTPPDRPVIAGPPTPPPEKPAPGSSMGAVVWGLGALLITVALVVGVFSFLSRGPDPTTIPTTIPTTAPTTTQPIAQVTTQPTAPSAPVAPPSATPANGPTAEAPTLTAVTPAPIFTATATATPRPAAVCDYNLLTGGFNKLYRDNATVRVKLGCPRNREVGGEASEQFFDEGVMYWWGFNSTELSDAIFVFYGNNSGEYEIVTTEESVTYPEIPTPTDPRAPIRGFGKIYFSKPGVSDRLGSWSSEEIPITGVIQFFDKGIMLFTPEYRSTGGTRKAILVLYYADKTFTRYDDTYGG